MKYDNYMGLEFNWDKQNCYTLLRSVYKESYNITLTDYANPVDWDQKGLDLYNKLASGEGFKLVPDWEDHSNLQVGDVLMLAIDNTHANHIAIMVDGNTVIDHLYGCMSRTRKFKGMYRNNLVSVYRHPDVKNVEAKPKVNLIEELSPHAKQKLEEFRSS